MRDQRNHEFVKIGIHGVVIVALASVVMFANLGGTRLWDRDEPRNAGCALEMMQRGDWVVPVFNAELRAHKPVLLYWLIISAYNTFGVNEFAARFWSAALAIGTALATYGMGRRLFNANVGLWAGIVLASSLMYVMAGRIATPDSALIFLSTAATLVYVLGAFPADGTYFPRRWATVAAMYGLMGLAVLAKGPVGAVLPSAVIGMFLLIVRLPDFARPAGMSAWRWWLLSSLRPFAPGHFLRTCWSMRPLTAVAVVLAVAGPWYAWVGWRTDGEFLRVFFWDHNLGRAAHPMEGHAGGPWFYPVAILVGFFPWSVFAAPVIADVTASVRKKASWAPSCLFAVCWIGVYVALFSLARTKLPSYVTPCYPALALLTACFIQHWIRDTAAGWRHWPAGGIVTLGVVGLVMVAAIPFAAQRLFPGETWLAAVGLVPLAGAVAAFIFQRRQRFSQAAWTVAVTAVAFATALFGWAAARLDRHQQNHLLWAAIQRAGGAPRIGAFGRLEPTWIFYGGRPIDELALDATGAEESRAGTWRPKPRPSAAEFFGQGQDRFIITTDRRWDELRAVLPSHAAVLAECPLFLRRERLLLVGAASSAAKTARAGRETAGPLH